MLLGDLMARFEDEALATETLVALGDLALVGRVEAAAAANDLTTGEIATQCVDRYTATATDEEWLTLIGLLGRADNPGQVFLQRVLAVSLPAGIAQASAPVAAWQRQAG